MAKTKMHEREIPQIDGGWQGAASLPVYEMMRRDRYTMAEIAQAFGISLRTLYNKLEEAKAPQTSEQARGTDDVTLVTQDQALTAPSMTEPDGGGQPQSQKEAI